MANVIVTHLMSTGLLIPVIVADTATGNNEREAMRELSKAIDRQTIVNCGFIEKSPYREKKSKGDKKRQRSEWNNAMYNNRKGLQRG